MRQTEVPNTFAVERFLPGENVLIDAINERTIKVEEKNWFNPHAKTFSLQRRLEFRQFQTPYPLVCHPPIRQSAGGATAAPM